MVVHAKIAEEAGAVSVMALERVPADIRAAGGVARMADPTIVEQIVGAVSIPVMAKCRIGHFVEAQVLESLGVDYIDESEVLTPADYTHHIDKWAFTVPFVCGATNLGGLSQCLRCRASLPVPDAPAAPAAPGPATAPAIAAPFEMDVLETDDLRLNWTNSLTVAMSTRLALKTSYQILYDNQPALVGVPLGASSVFVPLEKVDTVFSVAIVANF